MLLPCLEGPAPVHVAFAQAGQPERWKRFVVVVPYVDSASMLPVRFRMARREFGAAVEPLSRLVRIGALLLRAQRNSANRVATGAVNLVIAQRTMAWMVGHVQTRC